MRFTHERRGETDVFTTTDPAGRELANGSGEGRRVVSASVYTVAPLRHYDPNENRMVVVVPSRWSADIEMDSPDRFHDRAVHGGIYNERGEAEAWIAAMLGDEAGESDEAEAGAPAAQQPAADTVCVAESMRAGSRRNAETKSETPIDY